MKHFEIVTCWCITVNTGTLDVDILEEYTHQHRLKQFTSDFVPIQKKSLLRTCVIMPLAHKDPALYITFPLKLD